MLYFVGRMILTKCLSLLLLPTHLRSNSPALIFLTQRAHCFVLQNSLFTHLILKNLSLVYSVPLENFINSFCVSLYSFSFIHSAPKNLIFIHHSSKYLTYTASLSFASRYPLCIHSEFVCISFLHPSYI